MKIEVKNVSKSFAKKKVLERINLTFENGQIYGLIGHNGSGKSVLLKIICGFFKPTEGAVLFDDHDYSNDKEFPPSLRAIIEGPSFIPNISGFENLQLLAEIQNKITDETILNYLEKMGMLDIKDQKYSEYSLGTKQKLGIISVLMENPQVIILDEPFNGIEEKTKQVIIHELLSLKQQNVLIIVTSHIKEEISSLCDVTYVMENGQVAEWLVDALCFTLNIENISLKIQYLKFIFAFFYLWVLLLHMEL